MCLFFCNFRWMKIELLRSFELWTINLSDCTWRYTKWKRMMNPWPFEHHGPNGVSVYGSVYQFPSRKCSRPCNVRMCANNLFILSPPQLRRSGSSSSFDHEFHAIVNSTPFNWINSIVWPMANGFICSHERTTQTKILWKSQFVFGQQLFGVCLWNS